MARYYPKWKEVELINGYALFLAYMSSGIRGIGFLVVTWTTVVLLGGFVSMINKEDFWRLTLITLIQILWINASFVEKSMSFARTNGIILMLQFNLMTRKWQLTDNASGDHPNLTAVKRVGKAILVDIGRFLLVLHFVLLRMCFAVVLVLFVFGLPMTTPLSIYCLVKHDYYGDTDESRINMYAAHNVLYILCIAQGALLLYRAILFRCEKMIVNQVSQVYGFEDDGRAVLGYCREIRRGCMKKPSSARERNLITYAIELMESSKSRRSFLSGALILDRLITRQHSDWIKSPTLIEQEEKQQQQQLDLEDKTVAHLIQKKKEERKKRRKKKRKEERRNKKHQQREDPIIEKQREVIRRLLGSASSTHILQKLLQMLKSRSSYDNKMRGASARIVEHVAGGIHLEDFPRGIRYISSLIDSFEEYHRLPPYEASSSSKPNTNNEATTLTMPPSNKTDGDDKEEQGSISKNHSPSESESESESDSDSDSESESESESAKVLSKLEPESDSSSKALHEYKDLLLTGLRILWKLVDSEDNCKIIRNTKDLVSKIMAPVSYDLVHRTHHSAWSTRVVAASMRVMLRLLMTAKDTNGDTMVDLCQQISSKRAITTMEKLVTCKECKGGELQMMAMQILMQLRRCSFTKILVELFIKGDCSDVSIRNTAGKEVVMLFLGSNSVATLLAKKENEEFVGGLAEIISQVGNDDECRKGAAGILEHMCIHYTQSDEYLVRQKEEYGEYLSTLKNAMTGVMPKDLREIILGCGLTGEEGKPEYVIPAGTDIESQIVCCPAITRCDGRTTKKNKNENKSINNNSNDTTSSSPWRNKHHKLYVALLSLCVTACEKLHLDIDAILLGEDQREGVVFNFAMQLVQSNRDRLTVDSLTVIKLSTRMVIATMMKLRGAESRAIKLADLESLMDLLTSISETMLDLEGSMVYAFGPNEPDTAESLDSIVKQARKLLSEIKNQEPEIN